MKKTLLALMATASIFLASCGSKADSAQAAVADEALTVDNVLDNAEKYVGDTIVVEGECSHLCKHGGRKAFLVSAKDDRMLRAEAAGAFGAFEKDAIHKVLRVKGMLVEDRIDEAAVKKMEADYAKLEEVHGENVEVGCESEKSCAGTVGNQHVCRANEGLPQQDSGASGEGRQGIFVVLPHRC